MIESAKVAGKILGDDGLSLQLQRYMIAWTSCLVIVLGGVIAWGALQPPTDEAGLSFSSAFKKSRKLRTPASIAPPITLVAAPAKPELDIHVAQVAELKVPCKDGKPTSLASNIAQVRLTGHVCQGSRQITSTEIRNDTNGSSATVFATGTTTFTTDYLVLSPGVNKIRVLHALNGGGREEREFVLERSHYKKAD